MNIINKQNIWLEKQHNLKKILIKFGNIFKTIMEIYFFYQYLDIKNKVMELIIKKQIKFYLNQK